ncbi:hypothetical protein [Owenweeksia hongkongensis]|uniref:hypothetical protein n=1 Tax=Owenweeksia hongkongensis TaxID=253245 RepID=UPI003A94F9BA
MEQQLNETLRQQKLLKIQITEDKLRKFTTTYHSIKEHLIIKLTKDVSSFFIRLVLRIAIFAFIILTLASFLPEFTIELIGSNVVNSNDLYDLLYLGRIVFPFLALISIIITSLIKANRRRRTSLYAVSQLLTEIMDYLSESSEEEKRRYAHFVDNLADMEHEASKSNNERQHDVDLEAKPSSTSLHQNP